MCFGLRDGAAFVRRNLQRFDSASGLVCEGTLREGAKIVLIGLDRVGVRGCIPCSPILCSGLLACFGFDRGKAFLCNLGIDAVRVTAQIRAEACGIAQGAGFLPIGTVLTFLFCLTLAGFFFKLCGTAVGLSAKACDLFAGQIAGDFECVGFLPAADRGAAALAEDAINAAGFVFQQGQITLDFAALIAGQVQGFFCQTLCAHGFCLDLGDLGAGLIGVKAVREGRQVVFVALQVGPCRHFGPKSFVCVGRGHFDDLRFRRFALFLEKGQIVRHIAAQV